MSSIEVDREAVRVLATAVGVREAARKLGLDEDRVRQWSSRGKWFAETARPPTMTQSKTVTSVTKSPAVALQEHLSALSGDSRLSLAITGNKLAQHFEQLDPAEAAACTPAIKDAVVINEKVHSWNSSKDSPALINIQIGPQPIQSAPTVDIDVTKL